MPVEEELEEEIVEEEETASGMTEQEMFEQSDEYKEYSADTTGYEDAYDYSGKNVQELLGLSGKTKRFSYNCFEFLDIDHMDYEDMVDSSVKMQETLDRGTELLPTFRYLHEDIFMSLYLYNVKVLPKSKMHIQSSMNRSILAKLINTPMYINLRKQCRCDMFNAGVGTEIIGDQAIKFLEQALQQVKDFEEKRQALEDLIEEEEKMDDISDRIDEIDDLIEELEMSDLSPEEIQEQIEDLMRQRDEYGMTLAEARARAQQNANKCEDLVDITPDDDINEDLDDLSTDVTVRLTSELEPVTEEVSKLDKYVQEWGLGGTDSNGNKRKIRYGLKKNIIEKIRNSPYLQQFTDKIGQFKETAMIEQKKKSKNGAVEIKSVTNGSSIQDALSSDKMNLCNDITKKDFYRRMTENQLLIYEKESIKQKNKGPIIVCIDTSGSMGGYGSNCNDPIDWAKAMGVAILEIAQMQHRDFACIMYDSEVNAKFIIEKDENNPQKVIDIAEFSSGGGTDFEPPLRESLKLIEDSKFKNADIVFITDGECGISNDFKRKFNNVKEEKDFRVLGIVIDNSGWHSTRTTMDDFCDSVTKVSDFTKSDSEANKNIFANL